jgi:hypothetical protein
MANNIGVSHVEIYFFNKRREDFFSSRQSHKNTPLFLHYAFALWSHLFAIFRAFISLAAAERLSAVFAILAFSVVVTTPQVILLCFDLLPEQW